MAELNRAQIIAALDAGTLQMMRPWGDYVSVRRRGRRVRNTLPIKIFMENQVEACVTKCSEREGFPGLRIVDRPPR